MEEAANHVKNDMSKIGHEQLPKKAVQREMGFLIYMLCKGRLYIASNHMSPETEFLFTSYGLESTKRNITMHSAFISSIIGVTILLFQNDKIFIVAA